MKSMYIEDAKKKLLENGMPLAFVESLTTEQLTCYFDVPVTTTKPKKLYELTGVEYTDAAFIEWCEEFFVDSEHAASVEGNKIMFMKALCYGLDGCQNGNIF